MAQFHSHGYRDAKPRLHPLLANHPSPTRRQSQRRDRSRLVLSYRSPNRNSSMRILMLHEARPLPSWLIFDVRPRLRERLSCEPPEVDTRFRTRGAKVASAQSVDFVTRCSERFGFGKPISRRADEMRDLLDSSTAHAPPPGSAKQLLVSLKRRHVSVERTLPNPLHLPSQAPIA